MHSTSTATQTPRISAPKELQVIDNHLQNCYSTTASCILMAGERGSTNVNVPIAYGWSWPDAYAERLVMFADFASISKGGCGNRGSSPL
eukprot:1626238-Amphidinium_carterae.1